VREAGGTVTDPGGAEFHVDETLPNDLVAGNAHLHPKLRDLVADGVAAAQTK
jgi:myo-inositol-1(or 4)-monophosphatase